MDPTALQPVEIAGGTAVRTDDLEPDADSLFGLFFGAIGLGLLMLVQPCNYPMIPITVSIFSKGEKTTRARSVLRAGTYGVGIVVGFMLVAGLVQVVFGAEGQDAFGKLAANPWVNIVIGALFVYFAFSFFGYYELGLPAPLMRLMQLGNAKTGSDGAVPTWSLFLMGFFFVLTSYTCGAPVVLALFSSAAAAPHPLAILFATLVFAVTVALPYFVLSLVPGAVRALPKSGSWFSVLKATLGFLELGFALKFFRGAEVNLWDGAILSREVIFGCWAGLCVVVAVYLAGYLPVKFPHDPTLRPPTPKRLGWAAVFVVGAVYFGAGVLGNRLWEPLETFVLSEGEIEGGLESLTVEDLKEQAKLSPELAQKVIAARDAGQALKTAADLEALGLDPEAAERVVGLTQRKIRWGTLTYTLAHESYAEALKTAKEGDTRAFVVFTGHNCVNCQLMENTILPLPEVEAKLEALPRVALFIDRPATPRRPRAASSSSSSSRPRRSLPSTCSTARGTCSPSRSAAARRRTS
ncbi:MAG: cytochrome c biogenesis protein CcdA [Planctomycetota bacterium]